MRIGSLFSGYGGLSRATEAWFGATTAWVSDIDPGPRAILARRFLDAPNLGDITRAAWSAVEPVDILEGGSPCQDVSSAGKRAGMTSGTRSNLWVAMRDAIAALRPRLVIWENVRGAYSATADSDLEPCPGCVGGPDDGPVLRALGRVLGDLATLGYDAEWVGLRAADLGACHGRFRVFVVAHAAGDPWWLLHRDASAAADAGRLLGHQGGVAAPEQAPRGRALGDTGGRDRAGLSLLPTPAVNDMGDGKTVEWWDDWTAAQKARHGNGNGHGASLAIEAMRLLPTPMAEPDTGNGHARNLGKEVRLLPTPSVADAAGGHERRGGARGEELLLKGIARYEQFGPYAAAIARHADLVGRPAPAPTEPGAKGHPRLSARFTEWMMALPDGWVTDVVGRTPALKALGNGVVPPQAYEALSRCADMARASERTVA